MLPNLFGGALVALIATSSLSAAPLADDAKAFGARPSAEQMAISPSGDKVVMLVAGPGRTTYAKVFDLKTGASTTAVGSPGNPESLHWCQFASDTQLVCRYGGNVDMSGQIVEFGRLVTMGIGGTGLKPLGQRRSSYDGGLRQTDGSILDWLPGENGSVLMAREYVPEVGLAISHVARSKEGLWVDRIDLQTLKADSVEPASRWTSGYMTDGRGNVRLRIRDEAKGDGSLTGITSYAYRVPGSREWKPLGEFDARTYRGIYPLAIEAEDRKSTRLNSSHSRASRMPSSA